MWGNGIGCSKQAEINFQNEERSWHPLLFTDYLKKKCKCRNSEKKKTIRNVWITQQITYVYLSLIHEIFDWLKRTAALFFDEGVQKLLPRCDSWLHLHDDYVENQFSGVINVLQ